MPTTDDLWQQLFAAEPRGEASVEIPMRLLRKRGRPFLLLPRDPREAAACLDLYPAQTGSARAARAILRALLRASIPIATARASLSIFANDAFVKFLASQAGLQKGGIPMLGILAGNPATEGQRFLLLLFGPDRRPAGAVKAGMTSAAKALIEKERAFLTSAPQRIGGLPKLRGNFASPRVDAIALDFYPGDSPRRGGEGPIPALLGTWINANKTISLSETSCWSALENAAPQAQLASLGLAQMRQHRIHPSIQHGDFVPWNIKVSPDGKWTVLDWERGVTAGIPGWDWFHYVIQPAILVEYQSTEVLVERVEQFLATSAFMEYAKRAGLTGIERPLLLAYLLHMVNVIKPSEGLSENRALLDALVERRRSG